MLFFYYRNLYSDGNEVNFTEEQEILKSLLSPSWCPVEISSFLKSSQFNTDNSLSVVHSKPPDGK